MDSSSILKKYAYRDTGHGAEVLEVDLTDDLGSFGWLRGIKDRCVMLELRKRGGDVLAVSYGYIDRIIFSPSEGITVWVGGAKITIIGRNLNIEVRPTVRLFEGLTRHRVPYIQERSQADLMEAPQGACVVEEISW